MLGVVTTATGVIVIPVRVISKKMTIQVVLSILEGAKMEQDNSAYCDFNEQGYCKICGEVRKPLAATQLYGKWPINTWFQKRLAEVRYAELSKVQS
jgi:hypothetical protein